MFPATKRILKPPFLSKIAAEFAMIRKHLSKKSNILLITDLSLQRRQMTVKPSQIIDQSIVC